MSRFSCTKIPKSFPILSSPQPGFVLGLPCSSCRTLHSWVNNYHNVGHTKLSDLSTALSLGFLLHSRTTFTLQVTNCSPSLQHLNHSCTSQSDAEQGKVVLELLCSTLCYCSAAVEHVITNSLCAIFDLETLAAGGGIAGFWGSIKRFLAHKPNLWTVIPPENRIVDVLLSQLSLVHSYFVLY